MFRVIFYLVLAYFILKAVKSIWRMFLNPKTREPEVRGGRDAPQRPFRDEDIEDAKFKDLPDKQSDRDM